ncbi:hypothetical protein P3T76_013052 [Phytophthora citrophthora]|uniref:Transmembrane protein n=1 Tax=Phytophthora citrophthora TaxID=4793 RepID=A0AAD9LCD1_9STRA|nr:hypothetical protein P3T76_013052 [Phytophthora citrophthora]
MTRFYRSFSKYHAAWRKMVMLFCAIVGEENKIEVIRAPAQDLRLFLTKTNGGWLRDYNDLDNMMQNPVDTSEMKGLHWSMILSDPKLFGSGVSLGVNVVHVLVFLDGQFWEAGSLVSSHPRRKRWMELNNEMEADSSMDCSSFSFSMIDPIMPVTAFKLPPKPIAADKFAALDLYFPIVSKSFWNINDAGRLLFIVSILAIVCGQFDGDVLIQADETIIGTHVRGREAFEFVFQRGDKRAKHGIQQGLAQAYVGYEALADSEVYSIVTDSLLLDDKIERATTVMMAWEKKDGINAPAPESMLSTVPVDDAIRTLSTEMSKDKDASFIGKTEAEMEILAHYANMGRRRAALGAIMGSSVMAGLWKISKNQKRAAGAFAMMSGGLFGASYGIISIRRDLFSDLLMLPSDKSPFATRARAILMAKIPNNSFVQELNEKFQHSSASTDSWNEDANATSFDSKPKSLPPVPRRLDNNFPSSIPPITGLDKPRDKKNDEVFGEPNDDGSRSSFFFGSKPSDEETPDRDVPLSRDPYAHYSRDSGHPGSDKTPPLRHDEDDYFFGVPSEKEEPVKPTTWEEIRRRAAEQRK